jgi:hypothetical protein
MGKSIVIGFYAIVTIQDSPSTSSFGIAGKSGVVLGVASNPLCVTYAVSVDGEVDSVNEAELLDTGLNHLEKSM